MVIFSGASQIVFQLVSSGASAFVAITSSSVVSTRHLCMERNKSIFTICQFIGKYFYLIY